MNGHIVTFILCLVMISISPRVNAQTQFDHDNQGHSWVNVYLLAYVSYYAYRSKLKDLEGKGYRQKAESAYRRFDLEVLEFYNKQSDVSDTQAILLRDNDVVILAFSGSEAESSAVVVKDWLLTDARMKMREFGDVLVHSGFFDALALVYQDVKAGIEEHAGDREIWVTGHSLGAALAVMAAYQLDHDGIPVTGVYTYAGPRVGDSALVDNLEGKLGQRFQRWIAETDPVPRVPPNLDKFPYVPGGVSNIIHGDGTFELDADSEPGGVPNPGAHSMAAYVNYLYRGLPQDVRESVPVPPSLCAVGYKDVGTHPDDGFGSCKRVGSRKIDPEKCTEQDGQAFEEWCLFEQKDKYRYHVRELKD